MDYPLDMENNNLLYVGKRDWQWIDDVAIGIRSPDARAIIQKLQKDGARFLDFLEQHPENIPRSRRFIHCYQSRAKRFVHEYEKMEATGISVGCIQKAKEQLQDGLQKLLVAYQAEYENLLQDDFIDVEAEVRVLDQFLTIEGISPIPDNAPNTDGNST